MTRIHDLEEHKVESKTACVCKRPGERKKVLVIGIYRPPGLLKATWEHEINSIRPRVTVRENYANWTPKLRPFPA